MRSSAVRIFLPALLAAQPALWAGGTGAAASADKHQAPSFTTALAEAGLAYKRAPAFATSKDYRRGDWQGSSMAFWTLAASTGAIRLRLEMTKNISSAQAEKTMAQRFLRIDALYSGAAAYPGMVTTEFEVPPQLRPSDLRTGKGPKKVKVLAATAGLAYGAGAEDLVVYRGLLGYIYCENIALLAQIELFFPKAGFSPEDALKEFDTINCAVSGSGSSVSDK